MKTTVLQTILGLVLSIAGIQSIYIYVKGLNSGTSMLLLFLAFGLIGVGVYLLMRAGKSDALVFKTLKGFKFKKASAELALEQSLEKNDELTKQWSKTVEKRDKLKMLEVSTAAASEAASE